MLDIKYIRENIDSVVSRLNQRNGDFNYLYEIIEMDKNLRIIKTEVESLKAKRNATSKLIGQYKREKKDATELMSSIGSIGDEIKKLDNQKEELEGKILSYLVKTPNLPSTTAICGSSEDENVEIRQYMEATYFDFEPKPHWDLGTNLDILDFDRAAKITGSRFVVYKGMGARLERALISFMMDVHSNEHGYTEIIPPYIVNRDSMYATGQLLKFEEDMFKVEMNEKDFYLNPTAEVPTINLHRDELLTNEEIPKKYVSWTTAFRKEAGSAGRDTRGIIRQHQFNKIELIAICRPENGYDELDVMLGHAERILRLLELPYRVVELCTGDLGFAAAKTFDIEVWLPSYNEYKEISSISNTEEFQARRAGIRFKRDETSKPEYVHTLNGSGLAVGRTVVAILENYQQSDGSVTIPEILVPYMGCEKIEKKL